MDYWQKKWVEGYVILPCFTVRWLEGTYAPELTCNSILSFIFGAFFAPFWSGKVHLKKDA